MMINRLLDAFYNQSDYIFTPLLTFLSLWFLYRVSKRSTTAILVVDLLANKKRYWIGLIFTVSICICLIISFAAGGGIADFLRWFIALFFSSSLGIIKGYERFKKMSRKQMEDFENGDL
jgi:hypothetical protein